MTLVLMWTFATTLKHLYVDSAAYPPIIPRSALPCARRTRGNRRWEQAFDIDGVLVRGQEVLPGARESLKALEDARVPFVFVTNGGGERGGVAGVLKPFSGVSVPRACLWFLML